MRDAGDIHLSGAIVHIVDHHGGQLVLSEAELDLAWHDKLARYFAGQVGNALGDAAAGVAEFKGADTGARDLCREILAKPARFLELSQELARLLFGAMGTDLRISSGSLAACLYAGSSYPGESFLALLKIDPSEQLVLRVQPLGKGRQVTFDVVGDVMPTARERLQKAALCRQPGKGDYDLLLLDRQTEKLAANFFAGGFLGAAPRLDEEQRTRGLYLGLYAAQQRMVDRGVLPTDQVEWFRGEIDSAVKGKRFNLDDWLERVRLPEGGPAVIGKELKKKLGDDREFTLSAEVAGQLTEKRHLRGDYGLQFEVDAAHWDDVVRQEERRQDGKVLRLTIDVLNPRWSAKVARQATATATAAVEPRTRAAGKALA